MTHVVYIEAKSRNDLALAIDGELGTIGKNITILDKGYEAGYFWMIISYEKV